MTTKPRCTSGKTGRYADWDAAIAAALRVSRSVGPLRTYLCPECGFYHLTRRRRWVE